MSNSVKVELRSERRQGNCGYVWCINVYILFLSVTCRKLIKDASPCSSLRQRSYSINEGLKARRAICYRRFGGIVGSCFHIYRSIQGEQVFPRRTRGWIKKHQDHVHDSSFSIMDSLWKRKIRACLLKNIIFILEMKAYLQEQKRVNARLMSCMYKKYILKEK